MKIFHTEISSGNNNHISLLERDDANFSAPFHFHQEVELVYIKESYGKRIIGDKIEPFEAGDMVFIGSNLPHVWLNDEIFYKSIPGLRAKAIVLYFNTNVMGPVFYNMKEAAKINAFLKKGERGLHILGKTNKIVAEKLELLLHKKDIEVIIGLFEIFNILANSNETEFITSDGYNTSIENAENDRLSDIFKYVHENYKTDIPLATIAAIANLTPQSFCRMFKKRTNKHFIEYLNEVRISEACKLLLDTDWSISEVAYNCGYKTVSNFNKLFKESTGESPKAYRAKSVAVQ